jgi:hypothetical protein
MIVCTGVANSPRKTLNNRNMNTHPLLTSFVFSMNDGFFAMDYNDRYFVLPILGYWGNTNDSSYKHIIVFDQKKNVYTLAKFDVLVLDHHVTTFPLTTWTSMEDIVNFMEGCYMDVVTLTIDELRSEVTKMIKDIPTFAIDIAD